MNQIHLGTASTGEQVYIDIPTLVSTRLLITASSGGGKSETLRRILEEASQHIQCIVIDPEGEFSTLREKRPFVLVGEGGETAADIRTAALVATRLLELNASVVCDLYEMRVQDRHEWVRRFLDSMVRAPKSLWHPVLIFIDEAHTYCPEKGYAESVASQSVIDIANLGRKRGFCLIPATQRLSKLSKNVVEPMQNYLVGRTTFDDQARAASVFKIAPGAATRAFSMQLELLNAGQFIARGRAITGDLLNVQVKRGETRPPATGSAMAGVVTPTPEAIKALLPKLADLPHEAEEREQTLEDLRSELAAVKRQLAAKPQQDPALNDRVLEAEQRTLGMARMLDQRGHSMRAAADKLREIVLDLDMGVGDSFVEPGTRLTVAPVAAIAIAPVKVPAVKSLSAKPSTSMPKACRAILTALAQYGTCSKSRIAALTGYSVKGGGFNNSTSECRTKGWLTGSDPLTVTAEGMEALGDIEPLPSGSELLEMWLAKLGKAERAILSALAHSSTDMSKEELAQATEYTATGGGFNNAIGGLRNLQLVEGKQRLMLAPDFLRAVKHGGR